MEGLNITSGTFKDSLDKTDIIVGSTYRPYSLILSALVYPNTSLVTTREKIKL